MNFLRVILISSLVLFIGACVVTGPKSKYSKPADVLKEDSYTSGAQIGPVFVGERKEVTRKISGRIYCSEGMKQVPANKATIEIRNKNKVVRSTSAEVDGTYAFSSTFELEGEYVFAIIARCGKLTVALPRDLTNDLINQDFWIK